jgi:hypothetical protein
MYRSATPYRAFVLAGLLAAALAVEVRAAAAPEPRITSVSPAAGRAGTTVKVRIRGTKLEKPRAVCSPSSGLTSASVQYVSDGLVEAEIAIAANVAEGPHPIRVMTADGLSNPLFFDVTHEPVQDEASSSQITGPALIAGTLGKPGEVDLFWLNVSAGETWTFEAKAGAPSLDPALVIYEQSGSWFDSRRLNRTASNDEPLHFPGLSRNAKLTHRFEKAGRYALAISGFAGQGGPDCVYILRASRGKTADPLLHPESDTSWEERQFTRILTPDWLQRVASRGGPATALKQVETWEAANAESTGLPVVTVPGIVHGRIARAAETQAVRLRIDQAADLVLEIEAPKATMPRFNPVVRLLDDGGNEMVTNVYTKRNNNGLYMMKMIQPKSTVTLRTSGLYRLEIRDITTDCAGEDFEYRISIRQSIPHVGKVIVSEGQVNLRAGGVTELHLTTEREEDFAGTVAFELDGLPAGVAVVPGVANPVEKPPLPNGGKVERYTPKPQSSILLLTAAPDAPATERPVPVRLFVRPIVDKKLGSRLFVRELPLFVTAGGAP